MIDFETYSERLKIPVSEINRKTRIREIVAARQVYWFYLREFGFSFNEIGRMFGKNHSTVFQAISKIKDLIASNDRYLKRYLDAIEYKL